MYMYGSWLQADLSLIVVFVVSMACVAAIGVHVARAALRSAQDVAAKQLQHEDRTLVEGGQLKAALSTWVVLIALATPSPRRGRKHSGSPHRA
jgi:hypothetical protein